jgi:hypothetical protein
MNSETLSLKKKLVFNLFFKFAYKIDTSVKIWLIYLEKKKNTNYILSIIRAYLLWILSICKVQVYFCGIDSSTGQVIILTTFTGGAAGFIYSYLGISTLLVTTVGGGLFVTRSIFQQLQHLALYNKIIGPDNRTPEIKFPSDAFPVVPQFADKKPKPQMEYQKLSLYKPTLQFDTENTPIKEFLEQLQVEKMREEGRRPYGPIKGSKGSVKGSSKKLQNVLKSVDITLDDSVVPTKVIERIRERIRN